MVEQGEGHPGYSGGYRPISALFTSTYMDRSGWLERCTAYDLMRHYRTSTHILEEQFREPSDTPAAQAGMTNP